MLKGKTILLAVSAGADAYKMLKVADMLKKLQGNVHVLMTENAANFVTAAAFEAWTGNKCLIDTFDRDFEFSVEHVSLSKQADLVLIAPAVADIIGKIANGIADDMLTTTVMACTCPILVSLSVDFKKAYNAIVQENIEKLKGFGYEIISPETEIMEQEGLGTEKRLWEENLVKCVCKKLNKLD